jgi:Holliday junction resolvase
MNSCRKGKVGEREWAAVLSAHGFAARRGQQHAGGPESPDVVCPALAHLHFEVKRVEALRINPALDQAIADAASDQTPVVAWRQNQRPWVVVLRADDFLRLLRALHPATPACCDSQHGDGSSPAVGANDATGNSRQSHPSLFPVSGPDAPPAANPLGANP